MSMIENLRKAVDLAGGQSSLARMINVSQPRLWNWINRDKIVPAEFVKPICDAVDNRIKPHELRGDIFKGDAS